METANESRESAASHSRWRELLERRGVPELLLVALTFAVYARSLGMGFVYDDHVIFERPWVPNWRNVQVVFSHDVTFGHASNFYRPLALLWQSVVYLLAGTNPTAWHLNGILLHVLCVVLVFRVALQLLEDRGLATLAAAVFALHPTHVEAVTWVSDAADPLMAAVMLSSAVALLRWLKGGSPGWWVAAWLLSASCCFVKETGVLMPALLIVLALSVETKVGQPAILLTGLTFFASSFGFLILRSHILHGFAHPLSAAGNYEMALTLPAALWFYLSHLVFPIRLGPNYPLALVSTWQGTSFVLPVLLLAVAFALIIWLFARFSDRRVFWFCAVWALAPLAAPLYLKLFPPFELVHDRYLYLPTIALGVALAAGYKKLSSRLPRLYAANWLPFGLAMLLTASAVQTVVYQGVWRNDLSLFERAVALTPLNDRAIVNLGVNKLQQGNNAEGTTLLKRALEINPDNAFALFDLGTLAWRSNDAATAETYFQQAVAIELHPEWLVLLANVKFKLDKQQEAAQIVQQSLELDPTVRGAHSLLGNMYLAQGNPAAAASEFSTELQFDASDPVAQQGLQLAQQRLQQHN